MAVGRLKIIAFALLAALVLAAALNVERIERFIQEPEQQIISFERAKRSWQFAMGWTLPGTPDLAHLDQRLKDHGVTPGAPILMRVFKREFELEIWMLRDGVFHRFATYPICRWSGALGPKLKTGDRQAPEGFYSVGASQLNPNSRWHRSFNVGFPNSFDRSFGRTGSFLMVHGGCSSVGCYAMTNDVIDEIWKIVTAALGGGQKRFQVQIYPFRMSDEKLGQYKGMAWEPFWRDLKTGNDIFEKTLLPPKVLVCNRRYTFIAATDATSGSEPEVARCDDPKDALVQPPR